LLFNNFTRVLTISTFLFITHYFSKFSKRFYSPIITINYELIKKYENLNKHKKPNTEEEFGFYLAGLIEGDGYIGKRSIQIAFHISDSHLAYYIKKRIGYGNITKYSHTKNAIRYTV